MRHHKAATTATFLLALVIGGCGNARARADAEDAAAEALYAYRVAVTDYATSNARASETRPDDIARAAILACGTQERTLDEAVRHSLIAGRIAYSGQSVALQHRIIMKDLREDAYNRAFLAVVELRSGRPAPEISREPLDNVH